VPLAQYIQPNPDLRRLLLTLPQARWIFTNADANHARRVLAVLGLQDCFDGVIDIRAVEFACKPEEAAFRRALACSGNPDPASCVLFDDSASNLAGARRLGIKTVLIGANDAANSATPEDAFTNVDLTLPDLLALPARMPELWKEGISPQTG
jgi:pyrimidine 5'-nucleotidase